MRAAKGTSEALREAARKINVQGCPDDTPEPSRDIAATLTVRHLRRLEGHHGLAALQAFDHPALGVHHGFDAHLMNHPRGLEPPPGGNETVLAQVDDRPPHAQLSRLALEQFDLSDPGMNRLTHRFQGIGRGHLSRIGHRQTIARRSRTRPAVSGRGERASYPASPSDLLHSCAWHNLHRSPDERRCEKTGNIS